MPVIHEDSREVQFKVVYCGPPEGGKTSNLRYIHRRLDPAWRGDLVSIATDRARTLSFDFLPVHSMEIAGFRTKFQLFTVPGQKIMKAARSAVLAGADGVIFVADSACDRLESNIAAREDMLDCLRHNGIDPDSIPIVYQFNKRDLPDAAPPEELDEWLGVTTPAFLASATSGYQIFATLDHATRHLLTAFHRCPPPRKEEIAITRSRHVSLKTTLAGF